MFQLEAPCPALRTTTRLPNPQLSDQETLLSSVTRKLAMDGTRYTYVKRRGGRRKLHWTFKISRNKGVELRLFIETYFAAKIRVTDHRGRIWIGNFTNNPFELRGEGRAAPAIAPLPRGEFASIEVEFEGIEQ